MHVYKSDILFAEGFHNLQVTGKCKYLKMTGHTLQLK
jgi:hypothetical protein